MGRKVGKIILFGVFLNFGFLLTCCKSGAWEELVEDLKEIEMEDVFFSNKEQERISEIKGFIQKEQSKALKVVNSSSNRSRFLRMLGLQYMRLGMFGEAYNAFTEARLISPGNALLAYYQAVSAANIQKNMVLGSPEKLKYTEIAKNAYALALDLKSDFKEALYASAIFYAYELGDLPKALIFVNRLVSINSNNQSAWVLKGQIHMALGEKESAIFSYRESLKHVSSVEERDKVNSLIKRVVR